MKLNPMITAAALFYPAIVAADIPGFRPVSVEAPHHCRLITGGQWYPTEAVGHATVIAENAVFLGVEVIKTRPGVISTWKPRWTTGHASPTCRWRST